MTDAGPEITFGQIDVDLDIQEILLASSQHDLAKLRRLVRTQSSLPDAANVKDPETGFTPLHSAIAACEPDSETNGAPIDPETLKSGIDTVKLLLQEGAIWNDLDNNDETPGCLARRIGATELYELILDAGVRAEMLLNLLGGYEELSEDEDDEEDDVKESGAQAEGEGEAAPQLVEVSADQAATILATAEAETLEAAEANPGVTNARYLDSSLDIQQDRILDSDKNGVMMEWESEIMKKSAVALLPRPGLKVLNIGHGMGIVDGFFQEREPAEHHIVEAHADVVAEMKKRGWDSKPGVTIHEGRWQDILPALVGEGVTFDAIYYDTFAESYSDFREFFTEEVIGLLEQDGGKWGFFNGMGADRQISYDVYQKVSEMDLFEAGFDVDWEDIPVPKLDDEWKGVKRAYWVVDNYRLPLCRFMD
ncbi:Protein arginine N-methyltransferase 2 [Penicillium manginii]|jgi:protein arginine N-methyltransferase 2|uniref:Protein arginine N-methyltransferase 2 n=1 Tax=Penicillium manginii TaxID=203109 RepID=UPI002547B42D|nr:Protein arginine N-methyltransferase 2 [Penicillium manginii]KAJ5750554.1 Protein arginine N-methyltransferase 2 [Penicillium manginii]